MRINRVVMVLPASRDGCRFWRSRFSGFRSQFDAKGSSRSLDSVPNCCLKLTACGRLALQQTPLMLARRSLTMRWADKGNHGD